MHYRENSLESAEVSSFITIPQSVNLNVSERGCSLSVPHKKTIPRNFKIIRHGPWRMTSGSMAERRLAVAHVDRRGRHVGPCPL
jgi:hypothetical protein